MCHFALAKIWDSWCNECRGRINKMSELVGPGKTRELYEHAKSLREFAIRSSLKIGNLRESAEDAGYTMPLMPAAFYVDRLNRFAIFAHNEMEKIELSRQSL